MSDYIIRGTAANDSIRLFMAVTTETVQKAHDAHNTSNVATAALGRLLTGGVLMGSMLKNETDVMTLQVDCAGPIKGITVTVGAPSTGDEIENNTEKNTEIKLAGTIHAKGYCKNPSVEIPLTLCPPGSNAPKDNWI